MKNIFFFYCQEASNMYIKKNNNNNIIIINSKGKCIYKSNTIIFVHSLIAEFYKIYMWADKMDIL